MSVDTFSFALVLLEIAVGDTHYVHHYFRHDYCNDASYASGWRPPISVDIKDNNPKLAKLICACWASDPSTRPSFISIVEQLEGLTLIAREVFLSPLVDL